ncbi:L domain-like protein [Tothia fuscella]|uniref:L domain-like protein n=1 Tax=Tothia fuscella TaxID=1048955 RepID=A0A9P4TW41_9PEZI|nr:L domain-like protein [Tothia fuscella]
MSEPNDTEKPSSILSKPSSERPEGEIEVVNGHKHSNSGTSLHNAQGWDGKLRVEKRAVLVNPEVLDGYVSDAEDSDEDAVKVDQIEADEDLTADLEDDIEEIDLVHCRINSIPALKLERFTKVQRLCLRQNQIQEVELPSNLAPHLTELDLYDNLIAHVKGFDDLAELTSLDLSFNKIKHIKRVDHLKKLKDIYFVANKISKIENLEGLTSLKNLELGGNRIRTIEGLDTLTSLEQLWLGKNKINELSNLNSLSNLKILSIQSNRLRSISSLQNLINLEELHISHNALTSLDGLNSNTNLRVIDISANPIDHLTSLETLSQLEELWASWCKLDSFDEVEKQLGDKENLETVYFEGNPLQIKNQVLYRNKIKLALPRIKQIDATFVKVS